MTIDNDGVTVWDRAPRRRKGERPAPRPLDALESQVALIDVLHSERGGDLVTAMVTSSDVDAPAEHAGGETRRRVESHAARQLGDKLNTATTVVVTDRMLDFVLDRMPSIVFGEPLTPEDLLFESAYIVLSRPVGVGELVEDDILNYPARKVAYFDAGFYVPQAVSRYGVSRVGDIAGDDELISDGIMYAQSSSLALLDNYIAELREANDPQADAIEWSVEGIRELKVKHTPIYASGVAFGVSWDPELREEDFLLTPAGEFERRFWLSLLRTLKEEVFAPVRFRRAEQRRMARRGMIPDVVVADLRRVKHNAKEETLPTGETIMWSHRWRRRGHPRVLHRGTEKEKTVWVREHICGPESMPLIEKDRVYRLSK